MRAIARIAAVLAALVACVALAACGSDDDGGSTSASTTGTQAAAEADAFPVTIEHKFGETTIDEEPERVVVVGYTEQDMALALGVVPVAVRDFFGGYDWRKRPWAQEQLGGEEPEVLPADQINFEAVAAQRPDLILAINSGMTKADYEKLAKIAPTIAQSGEYVDYGMPWQEQTMVVGRALGREEQAQQLVDDLEAKFAATKEEHPEFDATAILAYGGADGYGAYSSQDTRSRFFTDLGMKMPAEVDELSGDSFYTEFSQEQFRLMDQDAVIMFGSKDDVTANPVFNRLDAVKEDRVIYLDLTDDFSGALGFASPLSFDYLIDEATPMLAAALDDDPKTEVPQPE